MTLEHEYKRFRQKFASTTREQPIERFNREVGGRGWTTTRGAHDKSLCDEILATGVDGRDVIAENNISFANRVKPALVVDTDNMELLEHFR